MLPTLALYGDKESLGNDSHSTVKQGCSLVHRSNVERDVYGDVIGERPIKSTRGSWMVNMEIIARTKKVTALQCLRQGK